MNDGALIVLTYGSAKRTNSQFAVVVRSETHKWKWERGKGG